MQQLVHLVMPPTQERSHAVDEVVLRVAEDEAEVQSEAEVAADVELLSRKRMARARRTQCLLLNQLPGILPQLRRHQLGIQSQLEVRIPGILAPHQQPLWLRLHLALFRMESRKAGQACLRLLQLPRRCQSLLRSKKYIAFFLLFFFLFC